MNNAEFGVHFSVARVISKSKMATMNTATNRMPPFDEMYQALCTRNSEYEGLFFVGGLDHGHLLSTHVSGQEAET